MNLSTKRFIEESEAGDRDLKSCCTDNVIHYKIDILAVAIGNAEMNLVVLDSNVLDLRTKVHRKLPYYLIAYEPPRRRSKVIANGAEAQVLGHYMK
jgi:hypothetical protein